jgi:hypothetical protein
VNAAAESTAAHAAKARASMESTAALCPAEGEQDKGQRDTEEQSPHHPIIAPLEERTISAFSWPDCPSSLRALVLVQASAPQSSSDLA